MPTLFTTKYVTDFLNVGITLLNIEMKGTNNSHTVDVVEHMGFFFRKVAYSNDDTSCFNF
jgi:hypothetical protein